jgi:hypothetical protein
LIPLGAGIPGADHAVAIQQVDGVVGHPVDQQLKPIGRRQILYGTGEFEFHIVHIRQPQMTLSYGDGLLL